MAELRESPSDRGSPPSLIEEIRSNRDKAWDGDRDNREEMVEDLKFISGDQWTNNDRQLREATGRPALQINRLPQFVRQVTGDIRINTPSIKVRPVDGVADPEVAKIYTGLIRHIESASRSDSIYTTSAENMARCGLGHFGIVTEFLPDSFEQEIRLRRINNPLAVLWDPLAQEPTKSDANYCFVDSEMDRNAFREAYPGASMNELREENIPSYLTNWFTGNTVTVAEYWRKSLVNKTIGLTEDGAVLDVTDMEEPDLQQRRVVRTRDVRSHRVTQYITNGVEILEGPFEWLGTTIPIVPVIGEQIHLGERIIRHGLVRYAKDPQRLYNYWQTQMAETIAQVPKAPYVMTAKQVAGYENDWQDADKTPKSYLLYNEDPNAPGPPKRHPPPDVPVAAFQGMSVAAGDMNATTGIYPPSLGERSNETSGIAIAQRQREGDVGSFVYPDNLSMALEYAGEILVEIIPKVYDSQRIVRILGEDGVEEMVEVNRVTGEDAAGNPVLENDLSVGKYDVRVDTGPSFTTRRQEAAAAMSELLQRAPEWRQILGDLLIKNMDWPGADEMVERIRKSMPEGLIESEEDAPQGPTVGEQLAFRRAEADTAKTEAEARRTDADATKKAAEAEGQRLENVQTQLEIMLQSPEFQQAIDRALQARMLQLNGGAI